ncbi:ornithine racemase Orr [Candidatus Clostridium stratigraminis]|uniref:Ornithine racemase Orr n=1 Tax=Candidatus Clostridium stratigraminis TaxID=3381661 RepID=A0ABW8T4A0_9CLOT
MKKEYPCIEVTLNKITHNVSEINKLCREKGIDIVGVSKVFCARKEIVEAMLEGGINVIGDSRLENLKKLKDINCKKLLLRIPMESHVTEVVKYSDISLNSEYETIAMLSRVAKRVNKVHNIILMVDLGDLREGVLESDVLTTVEKILKLPNIVLSGIGTNLTCYGGVIPDKTNLGKLISLKEAIKDKFKIELPIVSGGNSSSLYAVIDNSIPEGINQLRIGEGIVLGRETAYGKDIPNCYKDAFILKGEIIEIKDKPSIPIGNIGMDAFGETPHFTDKGIMKRAIVALGRQDIAPEGLMPLDAGIEVIGASSDHLILDITHSSKKYDVGGVVDFTIDYGCLLRAMTSPYIKKYAV